MSACPSAASLSPLRVVKLAWDGCTLRGWAEFLNSLPESERQACLECVLSDCKTTTTATAAARTTSTTAKTTAKTTCATTAGLSGTAVMLCKGRGKRRRFNGQLAEVVQDSAAKKGGWVTVRLQDTPTEMADVRWRSGHWTAVKRRKCSKQESKPACSAPFLRPSELARLGAASSVLHTYTQQPALWCQVDSLALPEKALPGYLIHLARVRARLVSCRLSISYEDYQTLCLFLSSCDTAEMKSLDVTLDLWSPSLLQTCQSLIELRNLTEVADLKNQLGSLTLPQLRLSCPLLSHLKLKKKTNVSDSFREAWLPFCNWLLSQEIWTHISHLDLAWDIDQCLQNEMFDLFLNLQSACQRTLTNLSISGVAYEKELDLDLPVLEYLDMRGAGKRLFLNSFASLPSLRTLLCESSVFGNGVVCWEEQGQLRSIVFECEACDTSNPSNILPCRQHRYVVPRFFSAASFIEVPETVRVNPDNTGATAFSRPVYY
eukprot:g11362.t1